MFACAFIQGSYFANQILRKIKLMYQQYLYYCSNEAIPSALGYSCCPFKIITQNQLFRIVSTLRLRIHEERINSKAKQNLHGFTLRSHGANEIRQITGKLIQRIPV